MQTDPFLGRLFLTQKKNWEKNKSHFKGSFISEDMLICSNLVEGED